jgi:hypothetical protein
LATHSVTWWGYTVESELPADMPTSQLNGRFDTMTMFHRTALSKASVLAIMVGLMGATALPALAFEPDRDLLSIKGYSPENIDLIDVQRSRQEWKEPAPPLRTPAQQFWHNVWNNDWTGSVDTFGRSVIREQL